MTQEEIVIKRLREKNYKFSSAESCTGGLLISTLINVPGASQVIDEGFITYANEAKIKYLSVKKETLEQKGAVSEETACEMAHGLYQFTKAQVTVSTTGIAGPDGGTKEKPVGTVYVGCCVCGQVYVKHLQLHGDRISIRSQTVTAALKFITDCLFDHENSLITS